ncbi:hypothetical protein RCL1_007741 [Eukaryota sp. TZLM3-RCL]
MSYVAPHCFTDYGVLGSLSVDFSSTDSTPHFSSYNYSTNPFNWNPTSPAYSIVFPSPSPAPFMCTPQDTYNYKVQKFSTVHTVKPIHTCNTTRSLSAIPNLACPPEVLQELFIEEYHANVNPKCFTSQRQSFIHYPMENNLDPLLIWSSGEFFSQINLAPLHSPSYPSDVSSDVLKRTVIPDLTRGRKGFGNGRIVNMKAHNISSKLIGVASSRAYNVSLTLFDISKQSQEKSSHMIADFSMNSIICDFSISPLRNIFSVVAVLENGSIVAMDSSSLTVNTRKINFKTHFDCLINGVEQSKSHRITFLGHPFQVLTGVKNQLTHVDFRSNRTSLISTTTSDFYTALSHFNHENRNPFLFYCTDLFNFYSYDLRNTKNPLFQTSHGFLPNSRPKLIDFDPISELFVVASDSHSLVYSFNPSHVPANPPFVVPSFPRPPHSLFKNEWECCRYYPELSGVGIGNVDGKVVVTQSSANGHVFLTPFEKGSESTRLPVSNSTSLSTFPINDLIPFHLVPQRPSETFDFSRIKQSLLDPDPIKFDLNEKVYKILVDRSNAIKVKLSAHPITLCEVILWFDSTFGVIPNPGEFLEMLKRQFSDLITFDLKKVINFECSFLSYHPIYDTSNTVIFLSEKLGPNFEGPSLSNMPAKEFCDAMFVKKSPVRYDELRRRVEFITELRSKWGSQSINSIYRSPHLIVPLTNVNFYKMISKHLPGWVKNDWHLAATNANSKKQRNPEEIRDQSSQNDNQSFNQNDCENSVDPSPAFSFESEPTPTPPLFLPTPPYFAEASPSTFSLSQPLFTRSNSLSASSERLVSSQPTLTATQEHIRKKKKQRKGF